MDSALEKLGLYDFFSVFLSGMVVVILFGYAGYPTITFINAKNDFLDILIFLLISYFIGLVILQELSSMIETYFLKFRKKACENFLNENKHIVKNKLELRDYQISANKILKKAVGNKVYDKTECEFVFHHCKTYIELQNKDDKISRIDSLFGMSRSFLLALPITIAIHIFFHHESLNIPFVVVLIGITYLFYRRCVRYPKYRVRVILRQYKHLKDTQVS